jgi:hypothetical protein
MVTKALMNSPADVIAYQRELVRTGDTLPLGRMQKISIGPNAAYVPPADPYIARYGRMIELRGRFLPIAHSRDRGMILVMASLPVENGHAVLPDLPDPDWEPAPASEEEILGREAIDPVTQQAIRVPYSDVARTTPRMIPQRLEDRTSERLQGTNFLVFQPVIRLAFQPEIERRLQATAWTIECLPDPGGVGTAFLVDAKTGECFFFGGRYDISGARG